MPDATPAAAGCFLLKTNKSRSFACAQDDMIGGFFISC
jgi:hypothetical protein